MLKKTKLLFYARLKNVMIVQFEFSIYHHHHPQKNVEDLLICVYQNVAFFRKLLKRKYDSKTALTSIFASEPPVNPNYEKFL